MSSSSAESSSSAGAHAGASRLRDQTAAGFSTRVARDVLQSWRALKGYSPHSAAQASSEQVAAALARAVESGLLAQADCVCEWCAECQSVTADADLVWEEESVVVHRVAFSAERDPTREVVIDCQAPETLIGCVAVLGAEPLGIAHVRSPLLGTLLPVLHRPELVRESCALVPDCDPQAFVLSRALGLGAPLVLDEHGKLRFGPDRGRGVREARQHALARLRHEGLLRGERSEKTQVGYCRRCGDRTLRRSSRQWFLDTSASTEAAVALAGQARQAGNRDARERLVRTLEQSRQRASRYENELGASGEGVRRALGPASGLCVSRQTAGGRWLPAFRCKTCDFVSVAAKLEYCPLCRRGQVEPLRHDMSAALAFAVDSALATLPESGAVQPLAVGCVHQVAHDLLASCALGQALRRSDEGRASIVVSDCFPEEGAEQQLEAWRTTYGEDALRIAAVSVHLGSERLTAERLRATADRLQRFRGACLHRAELVGGASPSKPALDPVVDEQLSQLELGLASAAFIELMERTAPEPRAATSDGASSAQLLSCALVTCWLFAPALASELWPRAFPATPPPWSASGAHHA